MLTMVNARVLVLPDARETVTAGGLRLPNNSAAPPMTGTVIGAGPNCHSVTVGDAVIYGRYDGHDVREHGIDYKILDEQQIYMRVVND